MSLWGNDFLLAHILLVILTPPILIPFANTLHSTMLCMSLFWWIGGFRANCCLLSSLATTFEADPTAPLLDQAKETTSVDSRQVHDYLCLYGVSARLVARVAYVAPFH